ncbi:SDR family NAD(P)-dependent oxidoreductase [Sphaerotilaceae bacterium SBD11-9]
MMLKDKVAIVYGGGGAIGGSTAQAFAREGARVFLAGRSPARLQAVAQAIQAAGGHAELAQVDALDEDAVEAHAEQVARRAGRIDIALNAVGIVHVQGTPLSELSFAEYAQPLHGYTRTNFLTARAVARRMVRQRAGVILTVSTPGSRMAGAGFLGYGGACAAVESLTRCLAGELGEHGVRAVCLRSDALTDAAEHGSHSVQIFEPMARAAGVSVAEMLAEAGRMRTLLKRMPRLAEVAEAAAFMASDRAGAITAAIVNLSCGSVIDV